LAQYSFPYRYENKDSPSTPLTCNPSPYRHKPTADTRQRSCAATIGHPNPTYGSVFLKMTNMAAEDRMPANTAKAMKRFNEMLPVENSINKMAKTSVSTNATSKMPFFLFNEKVFYMHWNTEDVA
jgi:hypothetical protein